MRLAKKKFNCPDCRTPLIGLTQNQVVKGQWLSDHPHEVTDWVCEQCDTLWTFEKKMGLCKAVRDLCEEVAFRQLGYVDETDEEAEYLDLIS